MRLSDFLRRCLTLVACLIFSCPTLLISDILLMPDCQSPWWARPWKIEWMAIYTSATATSLSHVLHDSGRLAKRHPIGPLENQSLRSAASISARHAHKDVRVFWSETTQTLNRQHQSCQKRIVSFAKLPGIFPSIHDSFRFDHWISTLETETRTKKEKEPRRGERKVGGKRLRTGKESFLV